MLSSRDNENTPERNPSEFGFLCAAINLFNFRRSVFSCVCREWSAKIDTTKLHYLCLLFEAFYALYARQSAFKLLSAIRFFPFFLLEMYFVCFEGGWRKSLVEKGLELLLSITSGGWVIRSKALNWGMEIKLRISSIEKRPRAQPAPNIVVLAFWSAYENFPALTIRSPSLIQDENGWRRQSCRGTTVTRWAASCITALESVSLWLR